MKKKIKVEQLKPGMFIYDFNCGWLEHPFFTSSMEVRNEKMIAKILKNGIREVYIDTDRGLDVADAPTKEEVDQDIQAELTRAVEPEAHESAAVTVREELVKAREIKEEAKRTVQNIMEEVRLGRQIEKEKVEPVVEKMVDSIFRNPDALTSLGRIRTVDEYTFFHSISVGVIMISFARHLGFELDMIKKIGIGGLLHDVGKMKIPLKILNKPGKLSEEEYVKIKEHAVHSRITLEQSSGIEEISVCVAAQHHERFDGTGYPEGLKGEEISKIGQMAAIVDVYDAITSDRCYHKGILPSEALKKLFEWSEYHFNKSLVQQFIRCMGIYPVGTLVRLQSGLLGVVLNHGEKSLLHPSVRIVYDTKRGTYISPYDIDLSQPSNGGRGDKVASCASPAQWNIIPEKYL